jgi:hypothetical protein
MQMDRHDAVDGGFFIIPKLKIMDHPDNNDVDL